MNSYETVIPIADIKRARQALENAMTFFEADQIGRSSLVMKELAPWPITMELKAVHDRLTYVLGEHLIQLEDSRTASGDDAVDQDTPDQTVEVSETPMMRGPDLSRVQNRWIPQDDDLEDDNGLSEPELPGANEAEDAGSDSSDSGDAEEGDPS